MESVNGDAVPQKLTEKALASHDSATGSAAAPKVPDDARSIASALSEAKSLRSIHSTASIKSILAKLRDAKARAAADGVLASGGPTVTAPRMITIDEEEGTRLTKKDNPSQLPYMHRNPAV